MILSFRLPAFCPSLFTQIVAVALQCDNDGPTLGPQGSLKFCHLCFYLLVLTLQDCNKNFQLSLLIKKKCEMRGLGLWRARLSLCSSSCCTYSSPVSIADDLIVQSLPSLWDKRRFHIASIPIPIAHHRGARLVAAAAFPQGLLSILAASLVIWMQPLA